MKTVYEVGRIVEDGKNKMSLQNTIRVEDDREALDLMRDGRNYVRRFVATSTIISSMKIGMIRRLGLGFEGKGIR